jgi:hypothetical protein
VLTPTAGQVLAHGSNIDDIGLLVVALGIVGAFVAAERMARKETRAREKRDNPDKPGGVTPPGG